jgi:DNA-binding winged helix-turn-helix (wHTH) protein
MKSAYLLVEKGSPLDKGTKLLLTQEKMVLGRSTEKHCPDISFDNFLISRNHCCITFIHDYWQLTDLSSKHGTFINGNPLLHSHRLMDGDQIGLASGMVQIRFYQTSHEVTLDFYNSQKLMLKNECVMPPAIQFDQERMQAKINGVTVQLTLKECQLLTALFAHQGELLTYDELCSSVWPERGSNAFSQHNVGLEEVNVLVYRVRKKLQVGANVIKTIRGRGFIYESQ